MLAWQKLRSEDCRGEGFGKRVPRARSLDWAYLFGLLLPTKTRHRLLSSQLGSFEEWQGLRPNAMGIRGHASVHLRGSEESSLALRPLLRMGSQKSPTSTNRGQNASLPLLERSVLGFGGIAVSRFYIPHRNASLRDSRHLRPSSLARKPASRTSSGARKRSA